MECLNDLTKNVCNIFGYTKPSEIQQNVLNNIPLGKDTVVVSQAGSGKTFAYLLALFSEFDINLKKLQAIIILPTRELASQTCSYFSKLLDGGIKINYKLIVGGYSNKDQKIEPDTQIIVGTIGKLNETLRQNMLTGLKFLILDEVDKLALQNKKKLFENLLHMIKTSNQNIKTLMISATYSKNPLLEKFFNPKILKVEQKKTSSNIIEYYHIFKSDKRVTYFEQKYQKLFELINSFKFKQAIIFYNQKGKGEEIASDLREQGWATTFIHGDMDQDQRILIYEKIKKLGVKLIVATDLVKPY
jgi:superfamily II DNA/RNA helicase